MTNRCVCHLLCHNWGASPALQPPAPLGLNDALQQNRAGAPLLQGWVQMIYFILAFNKCVFVLFMRKNYFQFPPNFKLWQGTGRGMVIHVPFLQRLRKGPTLLLNWPQRSRQAGDRTAYRQGSLSEKTEISAMDPLVCITASSEKFRTLFSHSEPDV